MNSIVNMFYGLDNSVEKSEIKHSGYKNNLIYSTPALSQGSNFKNYQTQIKNKIKNKRDTNNVNSKEGFQNFNSDSNSDTSYQLAERSKEILSNSSSGTDDSLQQEYNSVLLEYQKKLAEVSGGTTDFINRVNPSNPYLNKYMRWTDPSANGLIMYVTNQGVAKPITDLSIYEGILGKNGCPDNKATVDITIPWDASYTVEGTTIPSSPSLIVGIPMKANESCGNEGLNVYVDKLITNTTANYNGCYADNASSHTMTFIGGSPPDNSNTFITNGNFSQSQISNNSYKYLTWDTSTVPGWNFNCVLLNNSSAWGYPMPYPNGNQCASIQKNQELWTANWMSFSPGVTYTITFDACGRNCCDGSGKSNPIDVGLEGEKFYSFSPPINKWTKYSTNFTVDSQEKMRISFKGTWTAGDRSTAIQNIAINKGSSSSSSIGTYTYDMCKQASIDGGYKYFALQNVNTEKSMGYCAVSNDSVAITKNGTAYAVNKAIPLWDSKTNGSGKNASLTNQGTLTVYNSSGASIFNTSSENNITSGGYIGCYKDKSTRAMTNTSNNKYYSFDTCKQYAIDGNYKYYGSQDKNKNNNGWCVASNDLTNSQKYGLANNCTTDSSGNYMGGAWSNAIYSTDSTSSYYLILEDDGNMCIYRGTGPNDNQGKIWCSGTNGKQKKINPAYTAAKGKYGYNYIGSGTALAAGDFIGSTDGSIYLIMQSDGNLVLYTSDDGENCQKMKDKNTGGGEGANALYELAEIGIPNNLGKIGYVDSNSLLSVYGETNIEPSTNGGQPKLKNLPVGVSNKIVNIDSLAFENYPKTDKINTSYGLANANTTQKQELDQLKTRLDQISQQLAHETGSLNMDEIKVGNQSTLQTQSLGNYLDEYKNTNAKIKNYTSNMNNGIVNDSDINVLKENYNYYFWSILAVGTVLVTMNVAKQ